ncbi:zinc finger protein 438 [Scleropages formosus]|nr:zinc finger protein 438 [Scleropages formosus]
MKSQEQKMNQSALKSQVQNDPKRPCATKSLQFRNIAPKAPSAVPSQAVLTCRSPSSLAEATTPVSPRSIVVPAQNYALMQVAGREGTFSLVALPPSVSTQPPQPQMIQKDTSVQGHLKLPIPRYQPARSKSAPEKSKHQELQRPSKESRSTRAVTRQRPAGSAETLSAAEPMVPVQPTDSGSAGVPPLGLLTDNPVQCPGIQAKVPVDKEKADPAAPSTSASGGAKETLAPGLFLSGNSSSTKAEEERNTKSCLVELTLPPATTVLSPAVISKAVRLVSSPPKGKLPILPYPRKKNVASPVAKLKPRCPETQSYVVSSSPLTTTTAATTEVVYQKQVSVSTRQNLPQENGNNSSSMGSCTLKPVGKKRVKKRKVFEEMAFEARKKRSLSFSRRVTEKPAQAGPTEKTIDISKKYRSIMPKPLLMWERPPQLVAVSSFPAPQHLDHDFVLRAPEGAHVTPGSRQPHRCPVCSRCFRLRSHLQSHVRSHANSRPHVCPTCGKGFAYLGGLSAHAKRHHRSEGRPRSSLHCQFCEKAFGYVGVYFSHLREVHRVILTVEPSISQHEDDIPIEGMMSPDSADEQEGPVELQIKCGRCQATTPTFADMRLHLLHVHGEQVPERGEWLGRRQAEDELVRHAAHYWRELNERKNLATGYICEEEDDFLPFPKFKRDTSPLDQGEPEGIEGPTGDAKASSKCVTLMSGSSFNCLLCSLLLNSKEELLDHWRSWHHCADPTLLWNAFCSYLGPGRPTKEEEEENF